MASNLEKSIRSAAEKLAQVLEESSTLTIRTYITVIGEGTAPGGEEQRILVAETTIDVDGDYTAVIPVQRTAAGILERDDDLLSVHQQNVLAAIDHRGRSLTALFALIQ